jgi:hypothetical protein
MVANNTSNAKNFPRLTRSFLAFHRANPHTYAVIKAFALDFHLDGLRKQDDWFVSSMIDMPAARVHGAGNFPVYSGKDYAPYYIRLLIAEHPHLVGLFKFTGRRSAADHQLNDWIKEATR